MPAPEITVDRLELRLRAVAAPSRAAAIERRIRDAMERQFERVLAQRLRTHTDAELVFIDTLELACCANTASDDDRIVMEMAHRFEASVASVLRSTAANGGFGVRRFRDRAEWIAAYLLARLDGTASDRWWFGDLAGLRPLSLSAAIRTIMENEGDVGTHALMCLAPAHLAQVIAALVAADAGRVLAVWQQRHGRMRVPLAGLWAAAQRRNAGPPHDLLHACIDLERRDPGVIGERTVTLLTAFTAVMRVMRTTGTDLEPTSEALARWSATIGIDPGWVSWLDSKEVAELAGVLRERSARAAHETSAAGPDQATDEVHPPLARTDHGGIFVLVVVACWLDWPARWQREFARRPDTRGDAEQLSRALVLAMCAFALSPRPKAVLDDPAFATAFGVADGLHLLATHAEPVRAALRTVACRAPGRAPRTVAARCDPFLAGAAAVLLAALAQRVPGCSDSSPDYIRRNLLAVDARIAIEADRESVRITLTRAPLHVLLLLAGLTRATAMCAGRRFVLATEEGA